MNLEQLIYRRFSDDDSLKKLLAKYHGKPAVFASFPPDVEMDWGGESQYPRLVFTYDLQADGERKSAGTLSVTLLCQNTENAGAVRPEQIEPVIKECLRDVLLKAGEGTLYAFAWARTDGFDMTDGGNRMLTGCDIRFDILEYTSQETTDPDPVMAINKYVKELYPESIVIGLDRMEEITVASSEKPVVYCSLTTLTKSEETNMVAWMDGVIAVHILCPETERRVKMASAIANKMSLDGEIIMLDKSPMYINRLQADFKSDYLKDGQIFVTGHYGLLRYRAKPHKITRAGTSIENRR